MSRNVKIGFIILFILIVGLILSVVLSRQATQTRQNASAVVNINTSKEITKTKNQDSSMGSATSLGNYSNKLSKDNLGSITFSITDPVVGNPPRVAVSGRPTFPPKIPTVTPSSQTPSINSQANTVVNGPQRVKNLIMKIRKIEVHLKDTKENGNVDAWETLNLQTAMSIDLTQLIDGAVINFSLTKLAVGNYDEVRIYIENSTATLDNGSNIALDVNDKSGIVRVLKDFTVEKGKNTNLVMDFDAQQSVQYFQGKYVLDPFVAKLDINK